MLSLGSALALAVVAAWLIARAWEMPPILDLTVAVVAVRALGISRGVLGYCERLATHDTALRAAGNARSLLYRRLADAPPDTAMRWHGGELVSRLGGSVDELGRRHRARPACRSRSRLCCPRPPSSHCRSHPSPPPPCWPSAWWSPGVVAPWLAARAAAGTETLAVRHHAGRDTAGMLALEHAAELRVAGRLDALIAESTREQREWGRASDRAARPAAVAAAAPTLATGRRVLGAALAAIALASTAAPTTVAILMLLPLSAFEATAALPAAAAQLVRARIAAAPTRATSPAPATDARPAPPMTPVDLHRGDRLAVVGPSGSGKTTTADDDRRGSTRIRCTAGYFAEDAHLFDTTVRDNLLVARGDATDDELTAALDTVGLRRWLDALPDGLSTVLIGGAAAVSAGQRRRLLLARALVSSFPIVLLDEPTEHLDASDADRLLAGLLTPGALFAADRTVVVATHHLPAGLSCRVIVACRLRRVRCTSHDRHPGGYPPTAIPGPYPPPLRPPYAG